MDTNRGLSSAGRALAWHARGQGFESPRLQNIPILAVLEMLFYAWLPPDTQI